MSKGGKRSPQGGRPLGSTKAVKREVSKSVRFTIAEYEAIKEAIKLYGGRESSFLRESAIKKATEIIKNTKET